MLTAVFLLGSRERNYLNIVDATSFEMNNKNAPIQVKMLKESGKKKEFIMSVFL